MAQFNSEKKMDCDPLKPSRIAFSAPQSTHPLPPFFIFETLHGIRPKCECLHQSSLLWKLRVAASASTNVKTANGIRSAESIDAGVPLRKIFLSTET